MFKEGKKYILNLPHRVDRLDHIREELAKINARNFSIEEAVFYSPGWKGCTMSHYNAIRKANEERLSHCIIIEDDAVFSEKFSSVIESVEAQIPKDWDMVYFGSNNMWYKPQKITDNISRCVHTEAALCYAVNERIYGELLSRMPSLTVPHDVMYRDVIQKHFNCYCVTPNLVWQKAGYSDILEKNIEYKREFEPRWL